MLEKNIIFTFNPIVGFLAANKLDDAWNAYKKIAADAKKEINDFMKGIQRINFNKMAIYGNNLHIEFDGEKGDIEARFVFMRIYAGKYMIASYPFKFDMNMYITQYIKGSNEVSLMFDYIN